MARINALGSIISSRPGDNHCEHQDDYQCTCHGNHEEGGLIEGHVHASIVLEWPTLAREGRSSGHPPMNESRATLHANGDSHENLLCVTTR